MRHIFFCLTVLMVFMYSQVLAADIRNIELTDGSVVSGEIISFSNGIYTVKTESLGVLNISSDRILSITSKSSQPHTEAEHGDNSQYNRKYDSKVGDLQQQMLNNPALLQLIMSLQDNPEFKQALQDPAIQEAIKTGDISKLTSSPIINQILNNPTVQEIYKKVK